MADKTDEFILDDYTEDEPYNENNKLNRKINDEIDKPTSKQALKVLNGKEKELKEKLMKIIIKSKASNKEIIRTICFILNAFKRIK